MSGKKKIRHSLLIVVLALFSLTSLAAPARASSDPGHPVKPFDYVCTDNAGLAQDWNGKDPYTCVGMMNVYDANGWELINVKNGAKSDEPVDCSPRDENYIVTIFTASEVLGTGAAYFVWDDSWIQTFNCLST